MPQVRVANVDNEFVAPEHHRVSPWLNSPGKRAFDIGLAVLMLPLLFPVIAIIWFVVRLDGGPGFYGQVRVGRGGQHFTFWKIRTMVEDADAVLNDLVQSDPSVAREWHQFQKLQRDPRITRIGSFLRKTSLDELPQIWNVLRGEMSFVGPRPFMPTQRDLYDSVPTSSIYYQMRPGVTGLWQISPRNQVGFRERVDYDRQYAMSARLSNDLKIKAATVWVVLKATGR
ncbi:MAG: sugar transferase [Pseudomonadota bacterium]